MRSGAGARTSVVPSLAGAGAASLVAESGGESASIPGL